MPVSNFISYDRYQYEKSQCFVFHLTAERFQIWIRTFGPPAFYKEGSYMQNNTQNKETPVNQTICEKNEWNECLTYLQIQAVCCIRQTYTLQ